MKRCKHCLEEKELEEFYKHPLTKDGRMGRCRECVIAGRRTEHELEMARVRDYNRYHFNEKRRAYHHKKMSDRRKSNPLQAQAHSLASNSAKKHPELIPTVCPITGYAIEQLHHYDYSKPYNIIPCSTRGHAMIHSGKVDIKNEWIVILPEVRKYVKKNSLYQLNPF